MWPLPCGKEKAEKGGAEGVVVGLFVVDDRGEDEDCKKVDDDDDKDED